MSFLAHKNPVYSMYKRVKIDSTRLQIAQWLTIDCRVLKKLKTKMGFFFRKLARNICANFPCQCLTFIPLFWIKNCFIQTLLSFRFLFIPIQKDGFFYPILPQCTLFLSVSTFGGKLLTVHPWVFYIHLFAISEVIPFLGVKNL